MKLKMKSKIEPIIAPPELFGLARTLEPEPPPIISEEPEIFIPPATPPRQQPILTPEECSNQEEELLAIATLAVIIAFGICIY